MPHKILFVFISLLLFNTAALANDKIKDINDIHVVHFVLDGLRPDVLQQAVKKGKVPTLQKYFVEGGTTFENAITTFPTVSSPGYISFTTGFGAAKSGIFFLEWFDRETKKTIGYLTLKNHDRVNTDLAPEVVTLFEKLSPLPTAAIYTPFQRGATIKHPQKLPWAAAGHSLITQDSLVLNKLAMKSLTKYFSKPTLKIPRYTLIGLYGTDNAGHHYGPESEEVILELEQFDLLFKKFLNVLDQKKLREKTYLILSSDHGMHATGKKLDLRKILFKKGWDRQSLYISNRGVSTTFIYLRNQKVGEEIPENLIQALLNIDAIDWIAFRKNNTVEVLSSKGGNVELLKKELHQLFKNPRVGDILVQAKPPFSFRKAKAATHGSFIPEDMNIVLWMAGPTVPKAAYTLPVKSVDVYPTVLSWFGFPSTSLPHQEGTLLFKK